MAMSITAFPPSIQQIASIAFPTRLGQFRMIGFERELPGPAGPRRETALALIMGDLKSSPPLLRIHSQCLTGDALGSLRCDCGEQLQLALSMIAGEGRGILIYEEKEGRGIGLVAKLRVYELQDLGLDTVEANERFGLKNDYRDYSLPAGILRQLGVSKVRIITNNPDKVKAMRNAGIEVVERVPCEAAPNPYAAAYLETKKRKLGHLLAGCHQS
ncbi:MAG TPA: GTP cyclohydrolase II [Terriglobales bacterium]|nr:GTP cyclohydrolase II [Terriglobales bacterium]